MQAELFNYQDGSQNQSREGSFSFDRFQMGLKIDQIIGILIIMIILLALVYSWGIEKGQRLTTQSQENSTVTEVDKRIQESISAVRDRVVAESAERQVQAIVEAELKQVHVEEEIPAEKQVVPKEKTEDGRPAGKYTIQHVTYFKQKQADKEISKLISMGFDPFLIPSGKYLQVCVNGYQSYSEATTSLRELKAEGVVSPDAYIRNLA